MMDPKFYHNNNSLQRCDAFKILEEYSSRIRWSRNKGEKVLDIGCGDGGVTVDLLRPYIPENCAKLTGCDISQEMIRHANLHHKDDGIEFRVLDIADEMPLDMVEEYDHVFSFYALHWVQEQQRAMSNLHAMLAPGGDCLLTIICHAELYDSFRLLATTGKWSKYMEDIEHLVSPYQDSKDPAQEFTDLMHESGFIEVDVQCREKQYTFENVDMYKNFLKAVNPIKHRLSEEQYAEFCEDEIQLSRTMGDLQDREPDDDSAPVQKAYTMLVAYGVKGQITPRRP